MNSNESPATDPPRYWRVRLKCDDGDYSSAIWNARLIGIWHGSWTAAQLNEMIDQRLTDEEVLSRLREKSSWLEKRTLKTIWTFWELREVDWVFTSFGGSIHIAQPMLPPHDETRFSHDGERLKARRIANAKSFQLSRLPDCFRLLASAGQATLHQVHGTRHLVELLCKSRDESELMERWSALPLATKIEALGPRSWETLCEAYLILEEDYLPMGLGVGRTLPIFDLVGRSQSGTHLYAQCKGDREAVTIKDEFLQQARQLPLERRKVFFFSYAGVRNHSADLEDVLVRTNADILDWLQHSDKGKKYLDLLST